MGACSAAAFAAATALLGAACERGPSHDASPQPTPSGAHSPHDGSPHAMASGAHERHGGSPHAMASGAHSPHDGSPQPTPSGAHSPHDGSPHAMASGAHAPHAMASAAPAGDAESALRRVADVHGEAGPWAVAGYRMGRYALSKLGLDAQSFDLDVTHKSPASPQYACIADGAAAATGASVGKLNLHHVEGSLAELATTYRRRSTGRAITLRPSPAFVARFEGRPREQLAQAGRETMGLADQEIFVEVAP